MEDGSSLAPFFHRATDKSPSSPKQIRLALSCGFAHPMRCFCLAHAILPAAVRVWVLYAQPLAKLRWLRAAIAGKWSCHVPRNVHVAVVKLTPRQMLFG